MKKTSRNIELVLFTWNILIVMAVLLLAARVSGQEIKGPTQIVPGTLAVFEIVPPQQASWVVTPPNLAENTFSVDSSGSRLYFSTPVQGTFTFVAAIVTEDKKPHQLCATLFNGTGQPEPDPSPNPQPQPDDGLAAWIAENITALVKSPDIDKERIIIANCFKRTVESIDQGTIQSAANARTQLQINITTDLAKASNSAVTQWQSFLAALGTKMEEELGDQINSIGNIKSLFTKIQALLGGDVSTEEAPPSDTTVSQSEQTQTVQQVQSTNGQVQFYYQPSSSCSTGTCPTH